MAKLCIKALKHNPDGTADPLEVNGRNAWALDNLIRAGARGCTPKDNSGPRWSAYVHELRNRFGLNIETVTERHGGQFPGTHARYVLRDEVHVVSLTNHES